jgi:hypothetical protein
MKVDENLKYPIGKYRAPEAVSSQNIKDWIAQINLLPTDLRSLTVDLSESDLLKTYRPGGWNIRQIVHHIADSHSNSFIRFKWTLTEETPVIKAYYEDRWANLYDAKEAPIEISVDFIESLHKRWVFLLNHLSTEEWDRSFKHPETGRIISLKWNLGLYAWHGRHHLEHIKIALHS